MRAAVAGLVALAALAAVGEGTTGRTLTRATGGDAAAAVGRRGPPYAKAFTGAAACARCHSKESAAWRESTHARHGSVTMTPEGGCDGAAGSKWMQAYWRRDDFGFRRIVSTCYDLREKQWRPVNETLAEIRGAWPGMAPPPLVETEKRSFDLDCAGCHASQSTPRLDLLHGRMESDGIDVSINCETCHGPGAAHANAWARLGAGERLADLSRLPPRESVALCARCHGGPPTAGDYGPRDAGHFVTTIEDRVGLFPDGRAAGQVYQASAFVRSPCYSKGGLTCAVCHDSHDGTLRRQPEPDAACVRCHDGMATREHTFHDPRQAGARCVECHMPRLLTGLLAHQRDHRIGVPVPAIADAPDACTACHKDKSKDWADAAWRARWGTPPQETIDAVRGIVLARRNQAQATPLLRAALAHPDPYFRASAAQYLKDGSPLVADPSPEARLVGVAASASNADEAWSNVALKEFARDAEPRVRAAAAIALARRGVPLPSGAEKDLETEVRQFRLATDARLLLVRFERERRHLAAAATWLLDAISHDPELAVRPGVAATLEALNRHDEAEAVRALGAGSRRDGAAASPRGRGTEAR